MTKIYAVGNYDQLINVHKEKKVKKYIESLGYNYRRLTSFWDLHRMPNIMDFKREIVEGEKPQQGGEDETTAEKFARIHWESQSWDID